jgi:hypothetical protein
MREFVVFVNGRLQQSWRIIWATSLAAAIEGYAKAEKVPVASVRGYRSVYL